MYQFINPYNFVPLGKDITDADRRDKAEVYRGSGQKDLLSGWVNVELQVKTPLIIPDAAHPKYYDPDSGKEVTREEVISRHKDTSNLHKEYDFLRLFHPANGRMEYAIPGSEIRGMIRSAYEAVTNSCLPFLKSDQPMSQRVPLYGALHKRGLLGYGDGHWTLYSTEKELDEVIVVPVYQGAKSKFVRDFDAICNRVKALHAALDHGDSRQHETRYTLDEVRRKLRKCLSEKNIQEGPTDMGRKQEETKQEKTEREEIIRYLFVRAGGSLVEEKPGTNIPGKGWLQYNVPVDVKKVYHIAYLNVKKAEHKWEASKPRPTDDQDKGAEAYKELHSALMRDGVSGGAKKKHPNQQCNEALREALEKACEDSSQLVPVYYFIVRNGNEQRVYMSGSAAGRIAQHRKWAGIFEGHTPCGNKLCPACLLFGTTAGEGMKSHIRVSDAYMSDAAYIKTTKHRLRILGEPRTTAFEFYLQKPKNAATYWNFDFYGVTETGKDGKPFTKYDHLNQAMPRGRKMYWHHPIAPDMTKMTKMNSTQHSIDGGSFDFKLYFDQITPTQLKDLIWTITLGENTRDSQRMYKLGHAKPLGYGSVKLLVKDGLVRRLETAAANGKAGESYQISIQKLSDYVDYTRRIVPSFDLNSEQVKSLLKLCSFDAAAGSPVDYPRLEDGGQIYQWFSENRRNANSLRVLPKPLNSDLTLSGDRDRRNSCNQGGQGQGSKPRQDAKPSGGKETRKVVVRGTKPDRNDPSKFVASIDHGGMVFNVPSQVRRGDTILIRVNKIGRTDTKEEKIFGQFVGKE